MGIRIPTIIFMKDSLYNIRHSLAHLLAMAALAHDPKAKLSVGPVTDTGFYYDIDFSEGKSLRPEDLPALEQTMREYIKKKFPFTRSETTAKEARARFADNPYKLAIINDLEQAHATVSLYTTGDFTDLCEGRHVENTAAIDPSAFTLSHLAGAYFRGDEKNPMLTRVYGIAFHTKKELMEYRALQEEAKKRDHKKLGRELGLFTLSPLVGSGLPLLQPKGMILRQEIENLLWELHQDKGYSRVWTPHIAKESLYITSGHAEKFGDELFRVSGKEEQFIMKPMNCPHHMQLFADNQFSYRDLPVRYFEPATVYRDEKSGQLGGLTRVRSITQDDGHLFCRVQQIKEEVSTIVSVIKDFYTIFGMMDSYWVSLSVRGEDRSEYLGTDDIWNTAESALETIAQENGLNYRRVEGEAAFYGPKLDFLFRDALGREWQLATIQCDFNLPERFDLSFINEHGDKERPVVIHRAISGSLERFMGIMIEHYAGAFPLWLSPIQIAVLPIGETHRAFAESIFHHLKKNGIRVEMRAENESLGKRIRATKLAKTPYFLVIGDQEVAAETVMVEHRDRGKLGTMTINALVSTMREEISSRA